MHPSKSQGGFRGSCPPRVSIAVGGEAPGPGLAQGALRDAPSESSSSPHPRALSAEAQEPGAGSASSSRARPSVHPRAVSMGPGTLLGCFPARPSASGEQGISSASASPAPLKPQPGQLQPPPRADPLTPYPTRPPAKGPASACQGGEGEGEGSGSLGAHPGPGQGGQRDLGRRTWLPFQQPGHSSRSMQPPRCPGHPNRPGTHVWRLLQAAESCWRNITGVCQVDPPQNPIAKPHTSLSSCLTHLCIYLTLPP